MDRKPMFPESIAVLRPFDMHVPPSDETQIVWSRSLVWAHQRPRRWWSLREDETKRQTRAAIMPASRVLAVSLRDSDRSEVRDVRCAPLFSRVGLSPVRLRRAAMMRMRIQGEMPFMWLSRDKPPLQSMPIVLPPPRRVQHPRVGSLGAVVQNPEASGRN